MTNFVYIAISLDGFIAEIDGGLDWLMNIPNPEADDFGFKDFMDRIDAVVMGRKTFDAVLSFGDWTYTKPVFILSRSMKRLPGGYEERAELIQGEPTNIVGDLKGRGYENLYIDGGEVIRSFLKSDLVDEMIITHVPILLGKGIPLFKEQNWSLSFKHENTVVYDNGLVKSHYIRDR